MISGDQEFISFEDYTATNTGNPAQVHVDLGTPNQKLFGHLQGDQMTQDQNFSQKNDGKFNIVLQHFVLHKIISLCTSNFTKLSRENTRKTCWF